MAETKLETAENKQTPKKKKKNKSVTVKANKKGRHIIPFMNFLRCLIIPIYFIFKPFRFYGNRKVKDGPCIYISNHYTMFDPIYPASTTWEGIHFVAKKSIFKGFIVGSLIKGIKAISVNRDGNDLKGLVECLKCLKNGEKVCVYPEGTRNRTKEDFLPFRHGAAIMAIKSKAPIIPMVMYKKPRLFRCAHILIGDPFELSEYYDRRLSEEEFIEADNKLRDILIDMRRKHKEFLESKKKKVKA